MKRYFYILITLILSACYTQEIKVKALKDVSAYNDAGASYSNVDFIIPKNSICYLGAEVYGKTDKFVEVRCTNGLEGLVIEVDAFQPIK